MSFICERCDKEFVNKFNLVTHLKKKKICVVTNHDISPEDIIKKLTDRRLNYKLYNCTKCNKPFNSPQGRYNHENKCSIVPTIINNTITNNIDNSIHNTTNIQPTINITINAIGKENTSYLNEELVKNLFLHRVEGVIELFKQKHLNVLIPENNNIRKTVHKDHYLETFNGEEWESRASNLAMKELFNNIGNEIITFLQSNTNVNFDILTKEQRISMFNNFMDQVGIPLNWCRLLDIEPIKNEKSTIPISFEDYDKKKKFIYGITSENIYRYSKKSKECPF